MDIWRLVLGGKPAYQSGFDQCGGVHVRVRVFDVVKHLRHCLASDIRSRRFHAGQRQHAYGLGFGVFAADYADVVGDADVAFGENGVDASDAERVRGADDSIRAFVDRPFG